MMTIAARNYFARQKWMRRAGAAAFWFFMIKGLLWLAAPLVFYYAL